VNLLFFFPEPVNLVRLSFSFFPPTRLSPGASPLLRSGAAQEDLDISFLFLSPLEHIFPSFPLGRTHTVLCFSLSSHRHFPGVFLSPARRGPVFSFYPNETQDVRLLSLPVVLSTTFLFSLFSRWWSAPYPAATRRSDARYSSFFPRLHTVLLLVEAIPSLFVPHGTIFLLPRGPLLGLGQRL